MVGRVAEGRGEQGRLTAGVGNCLLRQQLTQVGIFSSVWREICKSQAEICLSQLDRRRGAEAKGRGSGKTEFVAAHAPLKRLPRWRESTKK